MENVGDKVKLLAKIVLVLGCVAGIVMLFALPYDTSFWFRIGALIGCVLSAGINALVLYAVGEAAEKSAAAYELISEMNAKQKREAHEREKAEKEKNGTSAQTSKPAFQAPRAVVPVSATWTCKKCGTTNSKANMYCRDCGEYK
jgi:hypothetical protein